MAKVHIASIYESNGKYLEFKEIVLISKIKEECEEAGKYIELKENQTFEIDVNPPKFKSLKQLKKYIDKKGKYSS